MSLKNDQEKSNAGLLEHELFLYQTMVNAAVEPITLIDRNYTYRIVNEAYIQARNLKREEVLNHSVVDVWGQEVFEEIIQKMENIACEYDVPPWITKQMAAWQVRLWLAQASPSTFLRRARTDTGPVLFPLHRGVRPGPLHVREQLPGRQGVLLVHGALELLQAPHPGSSAARARGALP